MTVLVTGASGFLGRALCSNLSKSGCAVRPAGRMLAAGNSAEVAVGDIGPDTDWTAALANVHCVIHCAARVHVMNVLAFDPLEAFRKVNTAGTLNLARQASAAGVKRFVFVSTVKVNGEVTITGRPFRADDVPMPLDPYGISKLEAEKGLRELEAQTGIEVVIVRPPLIYGPNVGANFAHMMRWVARGVPLPLGAVHNARSLVNLDNLVDLLITCLKHPAAAGQTFLVSDGEDVSTSELLRRTAQAMGRKAFLVSIPAFLLERGALLLGIRSVAERLCGTLQVDIEKTRYVLGWNPPFTMAQGLKKVVEAMKL